MNPRLSIGSHNSYTYASGKASVGSDDVGSQGLVMNQDIRQYNSAGRLKEDQGAKGYSPGVVAETSNQEAMRIFNQINSLNQPS